MKKISILILLGWSVFLCGQQNTPLSLDNMSVQKWQVDLDFICKKVEMLFVTEQPHLKATFLEKAADLRAKIPQWTDQRTIIELAKLMAGLQDAHSSINILFDGISIFDKVPLAFYAFEEEWYVIAAHPDFKELVGGKVVRIGQKNMKEVKLKIESLLSADNELEYWANGGLYLQMPAALFELGLIKQAEMLTLELSMMDGSRTSWAVPAIPARQINEGPPWISARSAALRSPFNSGKKHEHYFYEYLEKEGLFYCYYGRAQDQEGRPALKKFFRQMFKIIDEVQPQKLLIDLRNNSGGDYNKSWPLIKEIEKRKGLNQQGKIFVATSRHTYSAAVVTAIFLKQQTAAILLGEPGRSNPMQTDDASFFDLPNSGLRLGLTVKLRHPMPELGGKAYLAVDIPLEIRFAGFVSGKDPIWEYLKNN